MNNMSKILIQNSKTKLEVALKEETLLLNQKQFYELFSKLKSTINKHLKAIFDDDELDRSAIVRNFHAVQKESKRDIEIGSIIKGANNDKK